MQLYNLFLQHPVICTDSRNCPKGSIFFALKGDNFNANSFALGALEKGCAYAVVDEAEFAIDERFILVNNTLEALQALARYHREQLGTTIIGITGTNGKTTSKELIASVLKEKYNIHYTQGNLNNHIGVPLTLLQLNKNHELAVIEMGANHQGEIAFLTEIARPDFGIITNVGKAHLEGFGSFEGVMKTKAELYDFILKAGKKVFINAGNEHLTNMAQKSGLTDEYLQKYAVSDQCENLSLCGTITDCSPFLSVKCKPAGESEFEISTQLIGTYNAENILAAATIGRYFGLTAEQIKKGLESYVPQNNRSQLTVTERNKLVVDAYNANPTSMKAAVLNFAQMNVANKVLILGDMLELGDQSATEHQYIIDLLVQNNLQQVFLVGPEFSKTQNNFKTFGHVDELIQALIASPISDSYVLIKGSRGIKLEKTLSSL